jgi:hypothetical protein
MGESNKVKVHLLQVLVIDHDELGADEVVRTIQNTRYPNHCISPSVVGKPRTTEVSWTDDHPLNHHNTWQQEVAKLFPEG